MTKLIIKTVPDFMRKSRYKEPMFEETHNEITDKIKYLQSYRDNLNVLFTNTNKNSHYERSEHGLQTHVRSEFRTMSSRKRQGIISELNLIQNEITRLKKYV